MKLKRYIPIAILLLLGGQSNAQDEENKGHHVAISIPEVALVDLESNSGKNISLVVNPPEEAGEAVDMSQATDSSLWLNYSSVRGKPSEPNRSVYARITSGSVPSGLRLRVKTMAYAGAGDGKLGVPANNNGKVLNNNDRRVVKNIKTCYTGDGAGNGHQLIYSLEFRNNQYSQIDFEDSGVLSILYTITDN
ncbi:MAG: hypothetical protein JJ975_06835 [Bacteroidia bacterium]|nr:hypothetical protein [Bacteroidia bacterium]